MDCRASACTILRHTQATAMLKAGVHGKLVQERLGHTSISTTFNIYSHVVEGCRRPPSGSMRR
jgi:integrase